MTLYGKSKRNWISKSSPTPKKSILLNDRSFNYRMVASHFSFTLKISCTNPQIDGCAILCSVNNPHFETLWRNEGSFTVNDRNHLDHCNVKCLILKHDCVKLVRCGSVALQSTRLKGSNTPALSAVWTSPNSNTASQGLLIFLIFSFNRARPDPVFYMIVFNFISVLLLENWCKKKAAKSPQQRVWKVYKIFFPPSSF